MTASPRISVGYLKYRVDNEARILNLLREATGKVDDELLLSINANEDLLISLSPGCVAEALAKVEVTSGRLLLEYGEDFKESNDGMDKEVTAFKEAVAELHTMLCA